MQTAQSKADLHIHTLASDGTASAAQVLEHIAAHTDLRVIAITDHDTIDAACEAAQLARQYGIDVIIGEEVSTIEGHLLALFIERELRPGRSVVETIAAIHAQGGLAVAPHPFDRSVPSLGVAGALCDDLALDGIEGFNASVIWSQRGSNHMAQHFARARGMALVGGSDAHTLGTIGQGYTSFPGASAHDLYRAIQHGQVTFGGGYWSLRQYFDMGHQLVSQRGLWGTLGLAATGAGMPRSITKP